MAVPELLEVRVKLVEEPSGILLEEAPAVDGGEYPVLCGYAIAKQQGRGLASQPQGGNPTADNLYLSTFPIERCMCVNPFH